MGAFGIVAGPAYGGCGERVTLAGCPKRALARRTIGAILPLRTTSEGIVVCGLVREQFHKRDAAHLAGPDRAAPGFCVELNARRKTEWP